MAINHYHFQAYHPYLSFSDPNNSLFVNVRNGLPADPGNTDNEALFRIGKDAYHRLYPASSREEFDEAFEVYHGLVDILRTSLKDRVRDGILVTALSDGRKIDVDFESAPDPQIVMMAWTLYKNDTKAMPDFINLYSYLTLIHIDMVFVAVAHRREGAIEATIQAAYALSNVLAIESGNERLQEARQVLAYQGGMARHAETHAKRKEVVAYWKDHIYPNHPKMSNEKAAEWLKDTFTDLSMRTLAEYVAQAKREEKNIPPASTV